MQESKAWKCRGGHVMGLVVKNGSGVRELLLYRYAIAVGGGDGGDCFVSRNDGVISGRMPDLQGEMEEVEVMAVVVGRVVDVRCSVCGRVRTWYDDPHPSPHPGPHPSPLPEGRGS